jgi:hypothetical protein
LLREQLWLNFVLVQVIAEFSKTEQSQRQARLRHLLEQSSIYSGFLQEKLKKEREQAEKKAAKRKAKLEVCSSAATPSWVILSRLFLRTARLS